MTAKDDFMPPPDTQTARTRPRVLLAYLHLRPGTPSATGELLREYIETFAARAGYTLEGILVGLDDGSEHVTVRALVERLRKGEADTVLVSGPARTALAALKQFTGVQILTLADVSASHVWLATR